MTVLESQETTTKKKEQVHIDKKKRGKKKRALNGRVDSERKRERARKRSASNQCTSNHDATLFPFLSCSASLALHNSLLFVCSCILFFSHMCVLIAVFPSSFSFARLLELTLAFTGTTTPCRARAKRRNRRRTARPGTPPASGGTAP